MGTSARKKTVEVTPWPRGVSREPVMSIGQVVALVKKEFPALTVSKVRFIEDKGIVSPARTSSGYRSYSRADIERIRFSLAAQRDSYMPWAKIIQELQAMDEGFEPVIERRARIVAADGKVREPRADARITVRELLDLTGASKEEIDEMIHAGLLVADVSGRFSGSSVAIVRHCMTLSANGVMPRHLRTLRSLAERSVDVIDAVVAPVRAKGGVDAERAHAQISDLAEELAQLATNLIRNSVQQLR
ncbi:MAG: MerR family transcriptional regulator [Actinomycetaceae bacterium]|nr:MerR family transcriptional regulator [Actinomycetaceae bacterium]